MIINIPKRYENFGYILQLALLKLQVLDNESRFKVPFLQKRVFKIRETMGSGYLLGQAVERISESLNCHEDLKEEYILDAIVLLSTELMGLNLDEATKDYNKERIDEEKQGYDDDDNEDECDEDEDEE